VILPRRIQPGLRDPNERPRLRLGTLRSGHAFVPKRECAVDPVYGMSAPIAKRRSVSEPERPNLLTLLSERSAAVLSRATPARFRVLRAADATAFVDDLRLRRWHAIVVDPTALSEGILLHVAQQASDAKHMLLLLAPRTSSAVRRVVVAARHAQVRVVFVDCESTDRLLAIEMAHVGCQSIRASLLHVIAATIDSLPPSLRSGAVTLFGTLPLPKSAGAFAHAVGCSRRSTDRWARRAGFRGAACLLRSVRLAWAWELLRASNGNLLTRMPVDCGYGSARTLRSHSQRLLGIPPAKLSNAPLESDLIARLGRAAVGPPRHAAASRASVHSRGYVKLAIAHGRIT
jgi:hypothetical protein